VQGNAASRGMTRRVALALPVIALVVLSTAPAHAAYPGANGKILFVRNDGNNGNYQIYTMNSDGSGVTNVGRAAYIDSSADPVWSPDGSRFIYEAWDGQHWLFFIQTADGAPATRLEPPSQFPDNPSWSPDGKQIVYNTQDWVCQQEFCQRFTSIRKMNVDGTGDALIRSSGESPVWSPDGQKIAFTEVGAAGFMDIYVMNADGTGVVNVTDDPAPDGGQAWSPDGKRIVFGRGARYVGDTVHMYIVNADGTGETAVSDGDVAPAWSPDGSRLVFTSLSSIFTSSTDGSGRTQLTITSRDGRPDWQPLVRNYPRPKGAGPLSISLVPAYNPCTSPNSTHGSPLASPSCNQPVQTSDYLTVGTADSNQRPTKSYGALVSEVQIGDPATAADEADVQLTFALRDVRNKSDLSDYTGELRAEQGLRITDKDNGYGGGSATASDLSYGFTVPCAATADTTIGAECSLTTSADTLVPGTIREGKRAVWDLGELRVFDGGSDRLASTGADNTLFEVQGIFVP
jgi:hypothetical protein